MEVTLHCVPAPHTAVSDAGNHLHHHQELEPGVWLDVSTQVSQLEPDQPLARRQGGGHWLEGWRDAGR